MYSSMKSLIMKHYYETAKVVQEKLSVFYASHRISKDEYTELVSLVKRIYGE